MAGAATNPDPGGVRLRRRAGEDAAWRPRTASAARTTCCGAAARATTRCSTPTCGASSTSSAVSCTLVVEHKHHIGFKGTILIEPKPHEPTKHQYDYDVAAVLRVPAALRPENEVKVNIEVNHATLAGHSFEHEIARRAPRHLRLDRHEPRRPRNRAGTPTSSRTMPPELVLAMLQILRGGGFTTGGFNFDAKLRRQSVDPRRSVPRHIGGMDTLARALLAAARMIEDGTLAAHRSRATRVLRAEKPGDAQRQGTARSDRRARAEGQARSESGKSGKQEYLESLLNSYVSVFPSPLWGGPGWGSGEQCGTPPLTPPHRGEGDLSHHREVLHGERISRVRRSFWRSSPGTRRRSIRWDGICKWAAGLGYKGVQIPSWAGHLDLKKAAE